MTLASVKKINVTIQARMTSSRLPGKAMSEICGKPTLELMVERLRKVRSINGIIIATTENSADNPIAKLASELGVWCFRGSEHNVLSRVLGAVQQFQTDIIVQTTGDCPLIDPEIVESVIQNYFEHQSDYCSNVLQRTYPIGMDVQVFSRNILEDVAQRTSDPEDLEHVSCFIYKNPQLYKLINVAASEEFYDPTLRLTMDTAEDLRLIKNIFEALYFSNKFFSLGNILEYLGKNIGLKKINKDVQHNWINVANNR